MGFGDLDVIRLNGGTGSIVDAQRFEALSIT